MKKNHIKVVLIYASLTIIGAVLGYLIQPDSLEKYIGRLMSDTSQMLADGQKNQYIDIDNDGYSEEFIYYHLSDNRKPIVNQYSHEGNFQNTWYLEGEVVENFDFIWGNSNNDSLNEIFVFSKTKNTLYLYQLIPLGINRFESEKIPVCGINETEANSRLVIHSGGLADLNNDGFKEVIFSVNSRFSEQPRRVFAYDVHNKKMNSSPEIGIQLVGSPILFDINHDGTPEIFLSTFNSNNQENTGSSKQARNSASIVLNADLSFYATPFLYESPMSISSAFPWQTTSGSFIATINWSLNENEKALFQLQNSKGELLFQKMLAENNFIFDPARSDWSKLLAFHRDGWVLQFDSKGSIINRVDLKGIINQIEYLDIDGDKEEEVLIVQNNRLTIYRNNFSHPASIDIPGLSIQKIYFSVKSLKGNPNLLSLQNDHHQFLINYTKNHFYWFRIVLYVISVFVLVFTYWLIRHLQRIQVEHIKYTNEKFYEMQLDLIRNQLDPHFLFNALNSIAFSINTEDRKTAYSNLGLFSKFLREAIVSLDDFSRSLEEELDYVKNYLVLEKFRFKEKFNYDIIISPGISKSIKVPKLILFSFAESALKKGILVKSQPGTIQIMVDADDKQGLYIQIADDGINRDLENSKESFTKNMLMMEQVIAYFNSFNSDKITIGFCNNGTPDDPKGSLVKIFIPADYNYLA